MKTSLSVTLALSLSLSALMAHAADKPTSVKLCYENEDFYPWVLKSKPGLNIILLNAVEQKLGVKLELVGLPWKRCQNEMATGAVDGLFSASFKTERMEIGTYPMVGTQPDESKALMRDGYTLYRLKGSPVEWDGKKLTASGAIGTQPGYSIADQLKALGAKVDDGGRTADDNFRKLMAGRVDAVALMSLEGENTLTTKPEFSTKIEKVAPALVDKPYYLMLSKQFVAKYGDFAKEIWNTAAQVRDSADFKAKANNFK